MYLSKVVASILFCTNMVTYAFAYQIRMNYIQLLSVCLCRHLKKLISNSSANELEFQGAGVWEIVLGTDMLGGGGRKGGREGLLSCEYIKIEH